MNDEIRMLNDELPDGWTSVAVQELGHAQLGKMLDRAKNSGTSASYLRNINVRWSEFDLSDLKTVLVSDDERDRFSILDGDLFICEGGEPGRSAVWKGGKSDYVYQKALHRFRTNGAILPMLLMYRFRLEAEAGSLHESFSGSTIKHFTRESLVKYKVPLPPLPEQKRIADKLEAVLGRVDACRARLDRVPALLKRFRQSVLASATSGGLSAEWRMTNGVNEEWENVRLKDAADSRLGKMLDKSKNQGVPTAYLRNINVRWFDFNLSDLQELRIPASEAEELSIQDGDLLICEGGEPGRCAIWNGGKNNFVFQKALHRVRVQNGLLPQWLGYAIKHAADSGALADLFTGTTIKHLTGIALSRFEFPLPTLPEQQEIVRRVEDLFAFADRIEARLATAQKTVERLTPATLAKAFRGELVPQDPKDEPASALLERLRSQPASPTTKTARKVLPVRIKH